VSTAADPGPLHRVDTLAAAPEGLAIQSRLVCVGARDSRHAPRPGLYPASTAEARRCWRLVYSHQRLRRPSSLSDEVVNIDKELAGGVPVHCWDKGTQMMFDRCA
jgi:hypothetical protein